MSLTDKFDIIESNDYVNGKIAFYDDKKCKHNSCEARLLIESEIYEGSLRLELEAFEDTQENAINELNDAFTKLMYQFQKDFNLSNQMS